MKIQAKGTKIKNIHSSMGMSAIKNPRWYWGLKDQIPAFVNKKSHVIKTNPLTRSPRARYFQFL
jgi:hypothetical protein